MTKVDRKTGTQAEYAQHRGVSREAVSRAVKAGRITLLADGKIDFGVADIQWRQNTRARISAHVPASAAQFAAAGRRAGDDAGAAAGATESTGYWASRARREETEAQLAELSLREKQGELIEVQAIKSALATALSATRDALMQLPARLAPVLAAEADAGKVHELLQAELRRCLGELSRSTERVAEGDAA